MNRAEKKYECGKPLRTAPVFVSVMCRAVNGGLTERWPVVPVKPPSGKESLRRPQVVNTDLILGANFAALGATLSRFRSILVPLSRDREVAPHGGVPVGSMSPRLREN